MQESRFKKILTKAIFAEALFTFKHIATKLQMLVLNKYLSSSNMLIDVYSLTSRDTVSTKWLNM